MDFRGRDSDPLELLAEKLCVDTSKVRGERRRSFAGVEGVFYVVPEFVVRVV